MWTINLYLYLCVDIVFVFFLVFGQLLFRNCNQRQSSYWPEDLWNRQFSSQLILKDLNQNSLYSHAKVCALQTRLFCHVSEIHISIKTGIKTRPRLRQFLRPTVLQIESVFINTTTQKHVFTGIVHNYVPGCPCWL